MKRTISLLTAIIMVLSLITIPVTAGTAPAVKDAASLDEALNVEGGALHFEPQGDYTFVVEGDHAKSNNQGVGSSTAAVLVQGIDTTLQSVLRLKYKVSSESDWDFFYIYVDGQAVFNDSGNRSSAWIDASVIIPAGASEIKLAYYKDGSGDRYEDTAWLDDVSVGEYVDVTGVVFEQDSITLDINDTEQLVWTILPEDASNPGVEFVSSNSNVATVSYTGEVRAVNEGVANITVITDEGRFRDTIEVHVNPPINVESVTVTPSELTIPVLDSYFFQLQAEVLPENASFPTITWSSSDASILDVSPAGMVKGVAPGTAEAIATTPEGISGRCTITVVAQEDYPGVLSLDFTNISSLPFAESDIALGNGNGQLILYSRGATAPAQLGYAAGYSFTATPNQQVCFRTDWATDEHNESDKFDTYMFLVDNEGTFLAYNDDDTTNRPYSSLTYTFTDDRTYYVIVVPYYQYKDGVFRFYADDVTPEVTPEPTDPTEAPVTPTPTPIPAGAVFTYDDITVEPGENFSVTVALNDYNNDCNLLDMNIVYDPALLTYVGHVGGTLYEQSYSASINMEQEGVISAMFYGGDDEWSGEELPIIVYGDCTLVTITFTVNENAPSGDTALSLDINWFEDGDAVPLNHSIEAGTITIENNATPIPVQDITWDFEADPFENGWTAIDANDDGYNWEWQYDVSAMPSHGGVGMVASFSCINGVVGDISPDNWLISPAFIAGNSLSFYMRGLDPEYYADPVGIYVTTDGGQTWSDELAYFVCEFNYTHKTVDLSEFAGQAIQVGFRHYDIFGQYAVGIDDVTASGAGEAPETPTPVPPTPTPVPAGELDEVLNVEGGTLHFEPVGDYTFVVEETWAKSNNQGVDNSDAVISVGNFDFSGGAALRFLYKIGSEANFDKLQVVADGTVVFRDSGDHDDEWLEGRAIIPIGTQSVRFVYHKDVSSYVEPDTAWIDEIGISELVSVTGVEFTEDSISMPLGRTYQLEWNVLPENADITSVTFTVDNSEIATVSSTGLITGSASGDAVITITTDDGGFTDTIAVHVEDYVDVEQVIVNPDAITIPVTSSYTEILETVVMPENATDTNVTWESSNPEICTVTADGKLQGITPGTATITATSGNGVYGVCVVTVVSPEDFPGVLDLEYTNITSMPYFNGEVGVGISYGTPIFYQRNPQATPAYSYGTGFSYTASAGEVVRFRTNWYEDTQDPAYRVDTYITVFNAAGEIITFNDDAPDNSPYSTVEVTFDTAGTYYFVVAPYNFQNAAGRGLIQVIAQTVSSGITPGDVDGDGEIGMQDALLTARNSMGLLTLTDEQFAAADFNNDSVVNFNDVILIMRASLSLN